MTQNLFYLGHDERYNNTQGTLGYAQVGDYMDTMPVPPHSNITIRFIPRHYRGKTVTHCHNTVHADTGMFLLTRIVRRRGSLTGARIDSNGTYPGTCHPGDWYPGVSTGDGRTLVQTSHSQPPIQPNRGSTTAHFRTWLLANYAEVLADYNRRPQFYQNKYLLEFPGRTIG
nr:uncharacterized protein LOC100184168 [Ciona intestinalis]XP_026693542.1 uncharacterized protein LOC100184168 [Ciona intestinalis]|eukprot:XP_026693541.1 uncharacterized protein LOC100184168 [Ciona intestinalis]